MNVHPPAVHPEAPSLEALARFEEQMVGLDKYLGATVELRCPSCNHWRQGSLAEGLACPYCLNHPPLEVAP